jgi:hypothetical protein
VDAAAFKPLFDMIPESFNCSITLAVTADEMASFMADISVLLGMDLSNLGILAGFSQVFLLEAILLNLKLLR